MDAFEVSYAPNESPFSAGKNKNLKKNCLWIVLIGLIAIGFFVWYMKKRGGSKQAPPTRYALHNGKKGLQECGAQEFAELIASGKMPCVIAFVSPHCGYCQQIKPVLQEAAQKSPIPILTITDDTKKPWIRNVLKHYDVKGFPEIVKFKDGGIQKYQGDRSIGSILQFAA